jgi:hypothetical protein
MVSQPSNVTTELNLPPPEIRIEYYIADEDGYLKTTLHLTDAEAVRYTGLLTQKPPERPVGEPVGIQMTDQEVAELMWQSVRRKRAKLLSESDWVVARAVDTSTPIPANWQAYRQALRDITDQSDPANITWPTPP